MKKLNIAVVTHWQSNDNYGQILQLFALQKSLSKLGHNVYLIRYDMYRPYLTVGRKLKRYLKIFNLSKLFSYSKKLINNRFLKTPPEFHSRNFDTFFNDHIKYTEKIYSGKELKADPPYADIYITGSDQVWYSVDDIFFLNFGTAAAKRMSYAASFGPSDFQGVNLRLVRDYLGKIDYVTVREKKGLDICKRAGRTDALCVPDPTLLLPREEYDKLFVNDDKSDTTNKYILIYLLGNQCKLDLNQVYEFARENKLQVKYVASQGWVDEYEKIYPTIGEWLRDISNAEYIITNSFHGCVFSILYNKLFKVALLSGRHSGMNTRIETLLGEFKLEDRILNDDIERIAAPLNYNAINDLIEKQRNEILDYLSGVLK
ncbi:MAG: polysaccharide pyruvyl transferase family protein [Rikenellaceae bacterium]|nr:polysaccharide pyruvyl transferase family protein [Rikenellaceae bacterium]